MNILRLKPGDETIAQMAVANIKLNGDKGILPSINIYKRLLSRDDVYFVAAFEDDIPAGFLIAYLLPRIDCPQDMVLLYEIEIDERYRGEGIGKQLINTLKESLADREINKMWVLTNETNIAAMKLYEKTGGTRSSDTDIVLFEYWPE
jgi:ribosomal protein S18 acetylase RimI-like enzyme